MLEYLASGKAVIASWTEEYKDRRHLIEMVESNDKLPEKFREVISNLDHYNSPEKQAVRKAFALENTYSRKIQQIEELINKHVRI
jgi:5'-deoxynucleotidase YfbR-like HD superfamily hydrolase